MSLRSFATAAAFSLAAFAVAAQAAHMHRDHRSHRRDHHRPRTHTLTSAHRDSGPDLAWRSGGVWKEEPWLHRDERDWLDSAGRWHHEHDRYWRPTLERREYAVDANVFAMLQQHGFRRFEGPPFWYHGHYLVRTYHGRYIDLVEVDPYTNRYIGRLAS